MYSKEFFKNILNLLEIESCKKLLDFYQNTFFPNLTFQMGSGVETPLQNPFGLLNSSVDNNVKKRSNIYRKIPFASSPFTDACHSRINGFGSVVET